MTPSALGALRALLLGFALAYFGTTDFSGWAQEGAFWSPIWLFELFRIPAPEHQSVVLLQTVWRCALALGAVGLFTPISTAASALIGLYLIGLPQNFGKVHHSEAAFVIALYLLAVSRAGDAFSLDAVIQRKRGHWRRATDWEYVWPVVAIRTVLALALCAAGFAKLRHGGIAWVTSENMSLLLLQHGHLEPASAPLLPGLSLWAATLPLIPNVIAGATVAIELLNPLALFSRRARWLIAPSSALMIFGFRALLGPAFYPLIALHVVWLDLDVVLATVRKLTGLSAPRQAVPD